MPIKSKIHTYGDEKESSWPPRFPTKKEGGIFHWDREKMQFVEGYPPNPNNHFGDAPIAITPGMPKTYHEGAQRFIDDRNEWNRADKETGSITFSSIKEPRKYVEKGQSEYMQALKKDRRKASEEAVKMVRANPKEIRQKLDKQAEKQEETAKKSGLTKLIKEAIK